MKEQPTRRELKDRAWSVWCDLKDLVNHKYKQDDLIFLKHPVKSPTLEIIDNIDKIFDELEEIMKSLNRNVNVYLSDENIRELQSGKSLVFEEVGNKHSIIIHGAEVIPIEEIKKIKFEGTEEQARKEVTSDDLSHWYFFDDENLKDILVDCDTYEGAVDMWMGYQKAKKIEKHLKRGKSDFSWKEPEKAQAYERRLNAKGYNVYDAYPGGDSYVAVYTKLFLPKANNYGES